MGKKEERVREKKQEGWGWRRGGGVGRGGGGGKEEAGATAEALHRFTTISVIPRPHLSNRQDRNLTDPTRERVLRGHRVGTGAGSGHVSHFLLCPPF